MTKSLRNFQEEARFRILRLLRDQPTLSQREIAQTMDVSLGVVNYCLRGLIEKGYVKVSNVRASHKKLKYAYILTPRGIAEKATLTSRFLKWRVQEFEALRAEIAALEDETDRFAREQDSAEAK